MRPEREMRMRTAARVLTAHSTQRRHVTTDDSHFTFLTYKRWAVWNSLSTSMKPSCSPPAAVMLTSGTVIAQLRWRSSANLTRTSDALLPSARCHAGGGGDCRRGRPRALSPLPSSPCCPSGSSASPRPGRGGPGRGKQPGIK